MTLEERLAAVEQELADLRRSRLREAVKDLQEAMTVNTYPKPASNAPTRTSLRGTKATPAP